MGLFSDYISGLFAVRHAFEPVYHREHRAHRDEADDEEYSPALPEGPVVVHKRTDPEEEVTEGCRAEPETLAETLHMGGSDFGYERETERGDEEFGYCEEEV